MREIEKMQEGKIKGQCHLGHLFKRWFEQKFIWEKTIFIFLIVVFLMTGVLASDSYAWWSEPYILNTHYKITINALALTTGQLNGDFKIFVDTYADDIADYTQRYVNDVQAHGGDGSRNGGDISVHFSNFIKNYIGYPDSTYKDWAMAAGYLAMCIHLIEDMNVPAHAYNIPHVGDSEQEGTDNFEKVAAAALFPSDITISQETLYVGDPIEYYQMAKNKTYEMVTYYNLNGVNGYYNIGGGTNWCGDNDPECLTSADKDGPKGHYYLDANNNEEDLFPSYAAFVDENEGQCLYAQLTNAIDFVSQFLLSINRMQAHLLPTVSFQNLTEGQVISGDNFKIQVHTQGIVSEVEFSYYDGSNWIQIGTVTTPDSGPYADTTQNWSIGFDTTTLSNGQLIIIDALAKNAEGYSIFSDVTVIVNNVTPPSSTFQLPDTGQTKCYRDVSPYDEIPCAGTGQDGEYNINPMSYTDNGNGTVTDNNTGLMWQKCSAGQNNDASCSGTAVTYNWYQASGTYHSSYNPSSTDVCGSLVLGGYSDWRLPAKKELITIVDYSIPYPGPTIKSTNFPNTILSAYWSSTTGAYNPVRAWHVHFGDGSVHGSYKDDTAYVRCVRGGQYPAQNFTDNGNGTVTDNGTGLMWQKDEPGVMTWGSSLSYCEGLSLGGNTDWRLPNIKELESLTDDTRYNPAINTTYFPNANASSYWSSTTYAYYPDSAWHVSFSLGNVYSNYKLNSSYVRCVRGGQVGQLCTDNDHDGYSVEGGDCGTVDCNDSDANIHSGATETCNSVDDDCDGQVDEGVTNTYYRDFDGDGYGNPANSIQACTQPLGYVANNTDCDDYDSKEHPNQTWYQDADNDGYSNGNMVVQCSRPAGYKIASELTQATGDCDDSNPLKHPGAPDIICNGLDDDCDGLIDEEYASVACDGPDSDSCEDDTTSCVSGAVVCSMGDDDVEICNGEDDNCDGFVDENLTRQTTCGVGACSGNTGTETCTAGIWGNNTCDPFVRATTEICDNIDNNCDGQIDEELLITYYRDADLDGYGYLDDVIQTCSITPPAGYVANSADCDDSNPLINPAAIEACDGIDNDCDGLTDEGCLPDLIVSNLNAPAASCAGRTISIADTTKNNGTGNATASTTSFYLSTNLTLDAGDTMLCSRTVPALNAGASSTGTTACVIPAGTAVGRYYIIAKADNANAIVETNENNNLRNKTIAIGPDLIISSFTAPASASAGTTISISDTIKNTGGCNAPASITKFYLSTNTTLEAGDALLCSRAVPALNAGASSNGTTATCTIPAGTASGAYYIIGKADRTNVVAEAIENNNTKTWAITINP